MWCEGEWVHIPVYKSRLLCRWVCEDIRKGAHDSRNGLENTHDITSCCCVVNTNSNKLKDVIPK